MYLSALASLPPPIPTATPLMWVFLRRRFSRFLQSLPLSEEQYEGGITKIKGVTSCLNNVFWNVSSDTSNVLVVGSWGKNTQIAPAGDIDVMFFLPAEVYHRYEQRTGNKQSQLLQEVREIVANKYSSTARIRADGQVVEIPFNSISIEIVPAFRLQNGQVWICDTNDGGRYKTIAPEAEIKSLSDSDIVWNGNTRALARMVKRWQDECNVPIKSFQLEILAQVFLRSWQYSKHDIFWYDWMIRDFFAFLIAHSNGNVIFPITGETSFLGNEWLSKAQTAHKNALDACEYERDNHDQLAGYAWQKIFGSAAPGAVA